MQDSHELPMGLRIHSDYVPPINPVPFNRYYDPEFAKLEQERLWRRVWQFACREEDIPRVGDRTVYDVGADMSFVIVRSGPHQFKAFYNACLHRGTRLCNGTSSGASISCPFHGWTWNIDGRLKGIPSTWDFPHVVAGDYHLPEIRLETWDGFIFINPDPAAKPLATALGRLPEVFKDRSYSDRFTVAHVSKKIRANWKVVLEAFIEAYHVIKTHPDAAPFTGDASSKYDVWAEENGHVSRTITPAAVPSPHLGDRASVQVAIDGVARFFHMAMPDVELPTFDAAKGNARAHLAAWRRKGLERMLGRDLSDRCDSELIDSTEFHLFPNFCPWHGEGLPLVYQFLPYGDDPNLSVWNVRLTALLPGNGVVPPPVKINHLDFDDLFSDKAPEFGALAHIFDQDLFNLPNIQKGLKTAHPSHSKDTLGLYQESRIQDFHNALSAMLGLTS